MSTPSRDNGSDAQDRRLLAIVGPTATGKTEVGILLAERLGGEIVSADSMQVYQGMDIGTAKPTPEQRRRVPHHLIDIIPPDRPFSVAAYQELAERAIQEIWERGNQPILVGGSGLYVRAVLGGLDIPVAPPDPELRRRLDAEARRRGCEHLHARLASVDPTAAARIHPHNVRRVIRALEVWEQTGRPISEWWSLDDARKGKYNTRQFGLTAPRADLYWRIDARVDAMLADGLVEEVQRLLDQGYGEDLVSMQGLGYAQIAAHLRGRLSLEEAVERTKRDTRRFAKRQLTWFRADDRIEWIDITHYRDSADVAAEIERRWEET